MSLLFDITRLIAEEQTQEALQTFCKKVHDNAMANLELSLKASSGTIENILEDENHWSFIIKTSALMEMITSELLNIHNSCASLAIDFKDSIFNANYKLKLLHDSKPIDKNHYIFMRNLANLRNNLVHNADHVTIDINNTDNQRIAQLLNEIKRAALRFPRLKAGLLDTPIQKHGYKSDDLRLIIRGATADIIHHTARILTSVQTKQNDTP